MKRGQASVPEGEKLQGNAKYVQKSIIRDFTSFARACEGLQDFFSDTVYLLFSLVFIQNQ